MSGRYHNCASTLRFVKQFNGLSVFFLSQESAGLLMTHRFWPNYSRKVHDSDMPFPLTQTRDKLLFHCSLFTVSDIIHYLLSGNFYLSSYSKKNKKGPLKMRVTQSWLAIGATQISVNRLLPGRVTSALAPARHRERDISQQHSLSSYSYCSASGVGSEISW